jgi:hypothetical protein
MNCNQTLVAVVSMLLAAMPLAAGAQSSAPNAPGGTAVSVPPRIEQNQPPQARGDAPAEADARHCLELATNLEVIACAEKYRSRKGKR